MNMAYAIAIPLKRAFENVPHFIGAIDISVFIILLVSLSDDFLDRQFSLRSRLRNVGAQGPFCHAHSGLV